MDYSFEYLRGQLIGNDTVFSTPFGDRHIFYTDYTASGRGLKFIEEKLFNIQRSYANTHTKDDYSGGYLTELLHQSENRIKKLVNAGPNGKIVATGSGATGALKHLQEMVGVYIPPVTKELIYDATKSLNCAGCTVLENVHKAHPVVFVGPYEHHTNELMWREAFAKVVVIPLNKKGAIDLEKLESQLSSSEYNNRLKIVSFSAGSNITGIKTNTCKTAKIAHKYNAFVFFDFAAVAPYVKIDMNIDEDSYFDAIFFSPHKFIGGPGTPGLLVFNSRIYHLDLPPTTAGGGTVDYVGFSGHDFSKDIETRERAGTPPILQTIKAALVMDLKNKIGTDLIKDQEHIYTEYFLKRMKTIPGIEIMGDMGDEERIAILSFNIKHKDKMLHPKFVTRLMNDLFGIQSRAGCSCAGPYGHTLLGIGEDLSCDLRKMVNLGLAGLKPGWVRINLHYIFSEDDIEFLLNVLEFTAKFGHLFLQSYDFDIKTSEWHYKGWENTPEEFSIDNDFMTKTIFPGDIPAKRRSYFKIALDAVESLLKSEDDTFKKDSLEIESLKYFYYR
jgi:selenocysteine lyase/cysteine desulfurase